MKRPKFNNIIRENNKRVKLLIVDDVSENIEIAASILAPEGFILLYAQSGQECIEIAINESPDLILLDIMMPEMDGIEACKILKNNENTTHIPIIFLTAKTDDETLYNSFFAGGYDYIIKPFSPVGLLARVYNQLRIIFRQEALDATQKRLIKAQKIESLGLLAGGIAHDFNNQLNGIIGFSDLIKGKTNDEKITKLSDLIIECGERCAKLTNKLLAFAGKGKYQTKEINVENLINIIEKLIIAQHPAISVVKEYNSKYPYIIGDYSQIENVIQEIVNNALDAMQDKPSGVIVFSLADKNYHRHKSANSNDLLAAERYLKIKVTDTGKGIENNNLSKVFDPFFTTKDLSLGAGMSLSAVYGIIENHKGKISINSTINKGTTVSILLPNDHTHITESENTHIKDSDNAEIILVIDNNKLNRILLEDIIASPNRRVISAKNMTAGFEKFSEYQHRIKTIFINYSIAAHNDQEILKDMLQINSKLCLYFIADHKERKIPISPAIAAITIIQKPFKRKEILDLLS